MPALGVRRGSDGTLRGYRNEKAAAAKGDSSASKNPPV